MLTTELCLDGQTKKVGDSQLHTVECYWTLQNGTMTFVARWVELDNPMLNEISQRWEDEHSMFSFISWNSKTINMNTEQ